MHTTHGGLSLRFPILSLWIAGPSLTLSPTALTTATHKKYRPLPPPRPLPKNHVLGPFKDKRGTTCPDVVPCPLGTRPHDQTFVALCWRNKQPHFPPKRVDTWHSDPLDGSGKVQPHTDIPSDLSQFTLFTFKHTRHKSFPAPLLGAVQPQVHSITLCDECFLGWVSGPM